MIISKDINPERDFYYLGAKVIDIISVIDGKNLDFWEIFEKLNASEKISINLFTLTLDWLYIAWIIDRNDDFNLKKCF